ncbi:MFS general substrate transporter [Annulohypoxylon moriforme]|nr:MFS general substrate transporter [Annulohypoxylon moriforme]
MTSNMSDGQPTMATFSTVPDIEGRLPDIKDETGLLAERALINGPIGNETSHSIRRRIDLWILPLLCVTYALQFMDKTSMSYCAVYGILPDNEPRGPDYPWLISIFYFGYLTALCPGILIMQKVPLAKFLGLNIILWGIMLMITRACHSFACLATMRFFLGMFEATILPGFIAVTGIWWTRREQASRSSLWVSFLGVGSFVGTLMVYDYAKDHEQPADWRRIFLQLGSLAIVWGLFFLFLMPDGPASANLFNQNQKVVAIRRVKGNLTGTRSRRFVKAQVIEAVTDPKIILLGLISFTNAIASGGLAFGPLIIQGFGFSQLETILWSLPLSTIQVLAQLGSGYLFSRVRNSRLHIASIVMIFPIVGAILINKLPSASKWGRLFGVWLLAYYPVGFMVIIGLLSTNIAGTTKRSVATAWVFVCYCVGQISGPRFFESTEAPDYYNGIAAILCGFMLNITLNQVLRLLYVLENRRRDKALEGTSEEEIEALRKLSEWHGFEDATDKENVMFRYAL